MDGFPARPAELTMAWVAETLGIETLVSFDSERMSGGFWSDMVRLHLNHSDVDAPKTVVAKFANPSDQARFICSTFNFNRTELGFYRDLAAEAAVKSPTCYAAVGDRELSDYVLLMEDLGSEQMDQLQGCSAEAATEVVDALATLHSRWWEHPRLGKLDWLHKPTDPVIVERLTAVLSMIADPALENLNECPPEILDAWPQLVKRLPTLLSRLEGQPTTLTHGDVRLSNLFIDTVDPGRSPVSFVDWQAVRRAHGCYDLSYFLTQSLSGEVRRENEQRLIERYRHVLEFNGVDAPSPEDIHLAYKLCALYCLVYPIIAASSAEASNSPEALQIAERAFSSVLDLGALELIL